MVLPRTFVACTGQLDDIEETPTFALAFASTLAVLTLQYVCSCAIGLTLASRA